MSKDAYVSLMERWSQTAKDCTQIATAGLILPVFFIRDVLGVPAGKPLGPALHWPFYLSWSLLGLAVLIGLLYQATVTRLIEQALVGTENSALFPHWQFRVMIGAIVFGLLFFVVGVATS